MSKEQKLQALQDQLEAIKQEIEHLKEPETYYVVVHSRQESNWYDIGDVYKVYSDVTPDCDGDFHQLVSDGYVGVSPNHITKILNQDAIDALDTTSIKFRK